MKYRDRAEILSQLSDAFNISAELGESRLETEVVRMEGQKIARVTLIKDLSPEQKAYEKYPASFVVKDMIAHLRSRRYDAEAYRTATLLREAFVSAANVGDDERIQEIIETCKLLSQRLYGVQLGSTHDDMVFCFIENELSKIC